MSMVHIGPELKTYEMSILRAGKQGFVIEWYDDDARTDPRIELDGKLIRVIVGSREDRIMVTESTATLNVCTFHVSAEESDLPFDLYDGLIVLVDDDGTETPLVNLMVRVGPS